MATRDEPPTVTAPPDRAEPGDVRPDDVSTAIVRIYRQHFGRGPTRARTMAQDEIVTTVLEDGLTRAERLLLDHDRHDLVIRARMAFQSAMAEEIVAAVEEATGRTVAAFSSGVDVESGIATVTFVFGDVNRAGAPVSEVRQADPTVRSAVRAQARATRAESSAVHAQAEHAVRRAERLKERLAVPDTVLPDTHHG